MSENQLKVRCTIGGKKIEGESIENVSSSYKDMPEELKPLYFKYYIKEALAEVLIGKINDGQYYNISNDIVDICDVEQYRIGILHNDDKNESHKYALLLSNMILFYLHVYRVDLLNIYDIIDIFK